MVYIQVVSIFWHTLQPPSSVAVIWKVKVTHFVDTTVRLRLGLLSIVLSVGKRPACCEVGLEEKSGLSLQLKL